LTVGKTYSQLVAFTDFNWNYNLTTEIKKTIDNSLNGYWLVVNEDMALESIEYYEKDAVKACFHSNQKYNEAVEDKKAYLNNKIYAEIALTNQLYKKSIKLNNRKKIIADNLKLLLMDLKMTTEEENDLNRLDNEVKNVEKIHQKIILFKKIKTKSLINQLKKTNDFEEMKELMLL
jgi:hypothetical protein